MKKPTSRRRQVFPFRVNPSLSLYTLFSTWEMSLTFLDNKTFVWIVSIILITKKSLLIPSSNSLFDALFDCSRHLEKTMIRTRYKKWVETQSSIHSGSWYQSCTSRNAVCLLFILWWKSWGGHFKKNLWPNSPAVFDSLYEHPSCWREKQKNWRTWEKAWSLCSFFGGGGGGGGLFAGFFPMVSARRKRIRNYEKGPKKTKNWNWGREKLK